jgi:ubiquitin C-terminal hydrolase
VRRARDLLHLTISLTRARSFTSAEKLGAQQYTCTKCNVASSVRNADRRHIRLLTALAQESTKQLSVSKLPPVLCIQLKVPRAPRQLMLRIDDHTALRTRQRIAQN